ncbi:MAG: hypothetical protein J1E62_08360 [Lachnospiraceae bacterium]|nr:hypothetical protein [Lachnospiraceae bacterium]
MFEKNSEHYDSEMASRQRKRLIISLIIDIVALCFGISGSKVRMLVKEWKIFLIGILISFVVIFAWACYELEFGQNSRPIHYEQNTLSKSASEIAAENAKKEETHRMIEQSYRERYGMEIEFEDDVYSRDLIEKYAAQGEHLKVIIKQQDADYFLAHFKDTSLKTDFLCAKSADGQIVDSYFYDRMIELADKCGLSAYLMPNTFANVHCAYTDKDYQKRFGPVFVSLEVKKHSKDFYSKWNTYIHRLRKEKTIWREKKNLYVLFGGNYKETHKYKISHKKDKISDREQMKKLKKWISKPHAQDDMLE